MMMKMFFDTAIVHSSSPGFYLAFFSHILCAIGGLLLVSTQTADSKKTYLSFFSFFFRCCIPMKVSLQILWNKKKQSLQSPKKRSSVLEVPLEGERKKKQNPRREAEDLKSLH